MDTVLGILFICSLGFQDKFLQDVIVTSHNAKGRESRRVRLNVIALYLILSE